MTPDVLVIGESLIDEIRDGDETARRPGGSPMNVAIGLGRLGVHTSLATHLGDDIDGRTIIGHVRESGASVVPSSVGQHNTGLAIATKRSDGAADYEFRLDWDLHLAATAPMPAWVHIGSIATFISPGVEKLERLVGRLPETTRLSYDPNIRASLIPEHGESFAQFQRFARKADVVKLSDEDAAWLFGSLSNDEVLDQILALGPALAIMTQGERGALLATTKHRVLVPARITNVVDTIGAGDSYMASIIWQLASGASLSLTALQLDELGAVASIAAGITCSRLGANPPSLSDLNLKN